MKQEVADKEVEDQAQDRGDDGDVAEEDGFEPLTPVSWRDRDWNPFSGDLHLAMRRVTRRENP